MNNIDNKKSIFYKHLSDFIDYQRKLNQELYNNLINNYKDSVPDLAGKEIHLENKLYEAAPMKYEKIEGFSAPEPEAAAPTYEEPIPEVVDIFSLKPDDPARLERLRYLLDPRGVVYKFDRGISVINDRGVKVSEVFDGTFKHHTPSLARIARDSFGVNVLFDTAHPALAETAIDARDKGLISMCFEGGTCSIYLPDELTIQSIDAMIEEVEPRKTFGFICTRSNTDMTCATWEEMMTYLKGLRKKLKKEIQARRKKALGQETRKEPKEPERDPVKEITPHSSKNKLSINEYINAVLSFISERNISLLEYYRNVGRQYRVREESKLPEFERKNPFLEESDIKLLVERDDNKIVEYFARAMFKVINLNIAKDPKNRVTMEGKYTGTPEYPKEPKKAEEEKKIFKADTEVKEIHKPMSSDTKVKDVKKPFIRKRDPKELIEMFKRTIEEQRKEEESIIEDVSFESLDEFGGYVVLRDDENINIYTYDSEDKTSLRDRVTYPSEQFNIRSGYYLSLNDFFENLRLGHPDTEISFITEKGTEIDFNIIKKSIEEYCIEQGGIRLKNDEGKYVDDLFINRKDLRAFLGKFKIKYTSIKEKEDNDINVKGL